MIDFDPKQLSDALVIGESFRLRWIALEEPTFDRLKTLQRNLESRIRRDTSNAEVLKYLLHTHPEARQAAG